MERHEQSTAQQQGTKMAVEGSAQQGAAPSATEASRTEDFEAHARDYSGFIKMFKWLAIISFLMAMFVMFIIS
jgi:hypothetical protein